MSKILFFDLETTGVMHWKNGIHQISGCIEIDGEVKETFDFKVCPHPKCEIELDALKVSGVTVEQVKVYPNMKDVYEDFIKMLSKYVSKYDRTDKFHLCGYNNASFDNHFLRAFFVQNGDKYFGSWFWANTIDVMVLATMHLMDKRTQLPNFQLRTVSSHMGIEVDESKLHDGQYDIKLTRLVYNQIRRK